MSKGQKPGDRAHSVRFAQMPVMGHFSSDHRASGFLAAPCAQHPHERTTTMALKTASLFGPRVTKMNLFDIVLSNGRLVAQGLDRRGANVFLKQFNSGFKLPGIRAKKVPVTWARVS